MESLKKPIRLHLEEHLGPGRPHRASTPNLQMWFFYSSTWWSLPEHGGRGLGSTSGLHRPPHQHLLHFDGEAGGTQQPRLQQRHGANVEDLGRRSLSHKNQQQHRPQTTTLRCTALHYSTHIHCPDGDTAQACRDQT